MKTKCKLLTLAVLLSASPVVSGGEGRSSVGDLQGYGEDAYFAETEAESSLAVDAAPLVYDDVAPGQSADDFADETAAQPIATDGGSFIDTATSVLGLQPVAYVGDAYQEAAYMSSSDCGCGSSGGSCSSCKPAPSCRPKTSMACKTQAWMTSEALLWFPQARPMTALFTGAPAGQDPSFQNANAVSLYGGDDSVFATSDAIDGGLSAGFRIDGGLYLSENIGVGGRFWWVADNETEFSAAGNGTGPSFGRPFFDIGTGNEAAILINANDGNPATADFRGSGSARTALSMFGGEAYARLRMLSGKEYRADLLGGYSHFGIDDELYATSTSVLTNNVGGTIGDTTTYTDLLTAENTFHGGQIGMESVMTRGGWTVRALTKVHLGNMNQVVTGNGSEVFTTLAPSTQTDLTGGALAIVDYTFEEDVFAFAPELNIKLGYQFRKNVALTVGYSFLYWSNVALVGDNVNNVYDRSDITFPSGDPVVQPQFSRPRDSSLWIQGIDLGAVITF